LDTDISDSFRSFQVRIWSDGPPSIGYIVCLVCDSRAQIDIEKGKKPNTQATEQTPISFSDVIDIRQASSRQVDENMRSCQRPLNDYSIN